MTREETIRRYGANVGLTERWITEAIRWRDPRGCVGGTARDWPLLEPVEAVRIALQRQQTAEQPAAPSPGKTGDWATNWPAIRRAVQEKLRLELGINKPELPAAKEGNSPPAE
jgi:hypothetical protein